MYWSAHGTQAGTLSHFDRRERPTAAGSIKAVKVRASLTIGSRNYSPLPWLGESTNTVKIEPAARKTILLAAGYDEQMGPWFFALNHRQYDGGGARVPSKMDWTNMAPIPRHVIRQDSGRLWNQ